MQVLNSQKVRWLLGLLLTVGVAGMLTAAPARAGVVNNVTVTKGPGWVKVDVHGSGLSYSVKHMPPGSSGYRSIVLDVSPAWIRHGMQPKVKLPVNQGLVGQVRVRQYTHNTVRVYVDVIAWPKYVVHRVPGGIEIGIDAVHMRKVNPSGRF